MRAVLRMRGTSLPTVGPGTSARMMCIDRLPAIGRMAMMNTSMPMPPIQCANRRQNCAPCDSASMSVRMLAPVVVKPETISNSASR